MCEFLGQLPPLVVVSIDEGGEIDTVEFNKLPKLYTLEEKQEYRELLSLISDSIRNQDIKTIGQVATQSALLNQKLRPKKYLHDLIGICDEIDGYGVIVGHSGTCLGILLSLTNPHYQWQVNQAIARIREVAAMEAVVYHSLSDRSEMNDKP